MNKKIVSITLMAILLLAISIVFAQAAENGKPNTTGLQATQINKEVSKETTDQERTVKPEVKGLENAMLRVKNNETIAKLQAVLLKIQDKRKQQLAKLEGMEVSKDEKTNKTIVKGKGKAKFLGFIPTSKNYQYEVDDQGNVKKHGKAFDFMFKKEDPIDS